MNSKARRHHYVPQCYLKAFSVSHKKVPQICVFDRSNRTNFRTGIDNIASERDFNRFEVEGLDPNAFESDMSSFETSLGEALERIVQSKSLSDENDRAYLLNFICLLAIRNPRLRENMRGAMEQTARIAMDLVLQSKESYQHHLKSVREAGSVLPEVDYERMKAFFESGAYRIEADRVSQIQREMQVFEQILPLIFKRGWVLLRAPASSAGFITADHPVCLFWSDPKMRGGFHGPGLGLPGTELLFPISPRLALVGAFELSDGVRDIGPDHVAGFNGGLIALAERQVYARDHNFTYAMQPGEAPRKASHLMSDDKFLRKKSGP
ncbi:MAG TPA: DUF4238 domain-containing protein [Bradyrhizobium sp.]